VLPLVPLSQIVAKVLIAKGVATAYNAGQPWPVYVSKEPAEPDCVVTTYDISGTTEPKTGVGRLDGHPGIQVRVRANDYATAWAKAAAIALALDSVYSQTVVVGTTSYTVQSVLRLQDPIHLGNEAGTQRVLFTINARITMLD
jgi:hypothetical protein